MRQRDGRIGAYRLWIYVFNLILLILLIAFIFCACNTMSKERMMFFPELRVDKDPGITYLFVGSAIQIIVVLIGIFGVYLTHRWALRVYWIAMLALLVADVVIGLVWVFKFRNLHRTYSQSLSELFSAYAVPQNDVLEFENSEFCAAWNDVQAGLECCGPTGYDDWRNVSRFCTEDIRGGLPKSCCNGEEGERCSWNSTSKHSRPCYLQLLFWLERESDILFVVGYALLFTFKGIYIFILRAEMKELLQEIFLHKNAQLLQSSWVAPDLDVVDHGTIDGRRQLSNGFLQTQTTVTSCPGDVLGGQFRKIRSLPYFDRPDSAPPPAEEGCNGINTPNPNAMRVRFVVTTVDEDKG